MCFYLFGLEGHLFSEKEHKMEEKKLTRTEKHRKYSNMMTRCYNSSWQDRWGEKYKGTTVCEEWLNDKESFFDWMDMNYYEIEGQKMDLDHNILDYNNKEYSPDKSIIAPHDINVMYENLEVGTTNITYNSRNGTYTVKVMDDGEYIIDTGFKTYNEALDCYCTIKEGIIADKAFVLKGKIPEKLYNHMINTDVKLINAHYYTA